jgi:hypothetical protein
MARADSSGTSPSAPSTSRTGIQRVARSPARDSTMASSPAPAERRQRQMQDGVPAERPRKSENGGTALPQVGMAKQANASTASATRC